MADTETGYEPRTQGVAVSEAGKELGTPGCYMKFYLCVNSFAHF